MKVIIEGSPTDVRAVLTDNETVFAAAKANFELEQTGVRFANAKKRIGALEQELEGLSAKAQIKSHSEKISPSKAAVEALQLDVTNKNTIIAAKDAEIQRLQYELKHKSPIQLKPEQEAEVDALFQKRLDDAGTQPLVFNLGNSTTGQQVSAKKVIETVFKTLASGNRFATIRAIREVTGGGASLKEVRDWIDDALRCYGCEVSDHNSPVQKRGELIHLPVVSK